MTDAVIYRSAFRIAFPADENKSAYITKRGTELYGMYQFIFADDEDMTRSLFAKVLPFEDYGFKLAGMFSSAEDVLGFLRSSGGISAVLTDIHMGAVSGIDLCERVRKVNGEILLVCLTGYREFEFARRAIKCGVFDYLLKPTRYDDIANLFLRMKKHLDAKGGTDDSEYYRQTSIIGMIKKYIEANFNSDITLESMAGYVSMNPAYLSRFFKQHTGSNFLDYLTNYRIDRAAELLKDPTVRIGEICNMVGYKTPQHFIKLFKHYKGCTPSEMRAGFS